MEIVFDAQGNVLYTDPERFYQGSNLANVIGVTAPWSNATQVTIAFTLPNGVNLEEALMTNTGEVQAGTGVYRWTYTLPVAMTESAGKLTFQIFAYNGSGQRIATGSGGAFVERGVPLVLPPEPTPDVYQQILNELSRVESILGPGFVKVFTKSDWVKDGTDYKITIPQSEYKLTEARVENMIVNFTGTSEAYQTGVVYDWKLLSVTKAIVIRITLDLSQISEYTGKIIIRGV